MTVSVTLIVIGLTLSLAPVPAFAQATLTVDAAIQEMLSQNASLRAARAGAGEASEQVGKARAGWFPRLSFTESWQRGDQPVFVFSSLLASRQFAAANFAIDALNHPDPTGFFQASIGAEQLVFDGGRQHAVIESAQLRHDIARLDADQTAAALISSATQTYGRILTAEAAARSANAAVASAEEDAARAERRRDAGMATDADVLALVAQAATLRQRGIDARADAAVARAELNRFMGSPVDRNYQVAEPPSGPDPSGWQLDAALAEADANRPELRRAAAAIRLAEAERRSARTALMPQVGAQGAFDLSGTSFNNREPSWIVGGALRWQLSLGGAETAQSKAAASAQVRAAALADETRAAVQVEVVTAFRRLEAAQARQAVGRAAVDQARERQRIIRDRFDAGMAGVGDVLQASSALTEAEAERVGAIVDAMNSAALLRRAVGRYP